VSERIEKATPTNETTENFSEKFRHKALRRDGV